MSQVDDIFGPDGPLARSLPDFRPRASQRRMAARVDQALQERGVLVVEAGTGTGKTFAYLVPALLSGARVLISTGTRTLQDQLYAKDLPLVAGALGLPARVALLKGRSNYLCVNRWERADGQGTLEGMSREASTIDRVRQWAATTRSGDLADLPGLTEASPLWAQLTSTRENCLGARCADYARCHVVAARRAAQDADVVVVNHHLLLADLALKQEGFGDLLGAADAIILDEAHQIPDLATQFFGTSVSTRQIESLLSDSRAAILGAALPLAAIAQPLAGCEGALNALLAALPRQAPRQRFEDCGVDLESFVLGLATAVRGLAAGLAAASAEAAAASCAERAGALASSFERVALGTEDEGVRTVETGTRGAQLALLPFEVAARFRAMMQSHRAAWVFTSATLSVAGDFGHFVRRLGLDDAPTLGIPSPFDFQRQALLYLPRALPDPSDPGYTDAVLDVALPLIARSGGGAFVLFTSHRALARAAARVRERDALPPGLPLLVQGEGPRERLLREFREHGDAVLFGTSSFWEGVDVKGEALRLVVIEKLPFASPEDPLVKARIEFLRRKERNPFNEYQLPEAALALAQGFGRLIRSEEDFGLIAICDPRLTRKGYGQVFLRSLPDVRTTQELDEALRFLGTLAPARPRSAAAAGPGRARRRSRARATP
jgi:ATP-dependent DNA helicase DinG